jgi:quinol monooxygenase YgiN
MFEPGQLYSNGVWKVKNGQEENFKAVWKEFAELALKNHGALEGTLLQEIDNTKIFVSFGLWENTEYTQKWQNSPEFKSYMAKFKDLCDSMQIKILKSIEKINK